MVPKTSDEFLIRLVEDLSALKANVSNLDDQFEKMEERIIDPFSELMYKVQFHSQEIDKLKLKIFELEEKDKKQETEIKEAKERLDKYKWYGAGIFATISIIFVVMYNIIYLSIPFIKH